MFYGLVPGEDPRQTMTAARLRKLGADLSGEGELDFLALPMGTEQPPEQLKQLKPQGLCFAIRPGESLRQQAGDRLVELDKVPAFKYRNAVPTAEAALALAVGNTRDTIFGCPVLVIGYGAIGSRLCANLVALGAHVTASARRPEDLVRIVQAGCRAVHTDALEQTARAYGMVFNTVPAPVLTKGLLEQLPCSCLVLDLASGRGGLAPGAKPKNYIQALALPGKTAPAAAARATADTVWEMLEVAHAD